MTTIAIIDSALEKSTSYLQDNHNLPSLYASHLHQDINIKRKRKLRTKFKEAEVRVIQTILKCTDIATMRLGVPTSKGSLNMYGWDSILKRAGVSRSSGYAILHMLRQAGYVSTKSVEGQYLVIKNISAKLFFELGISRKYFATQRAKLKSLREKIIGRAEGKMSEKNITITSHMNMLIANEKAKSKERILPDNTQKKCAPKSKVASDYLAQIREMLGTKNPLEE